MIRICSSAEELFKRGQISARAFDVELIKLVSQKRTGRTRQQHGTLSDLDFC